MKKILIFTYLERHLKKMIPIINELKKDKKISLAVLLMTKEEESMAIESGIEYKMLDEFTEKKRQYDFDLGWGLEPLINAIDQIDPDLFLAIEVNFILRNAIRYCKEKQIKSIIVQHGTPNKYSLHAFAPFEADLFLAWGDFSKDFLTQNNIPLEKIKLTGGISFDRTRALSSNKKHISETLNLDPEKKWILFTTQGSGAGNMPTPEEIESGVVETAKALADNNDVQLIYQVHPSQGIEAIENFLRDMHLGSHIICKYKDTEELIKSSDAMITFFSTTAIDAVLLKKPLMLINLSDDKDFLPFAKMGVAIAVHDISDIGPSVKKILNWPATDNKFYDKAARYINYKNDGKALERVMSIIYENIGG